MKPSVQPSGRAEPYEVDVQLVSAELSCRSVSLERGYLLRVEARVVGHGRNIYFARSEARDASGALVAIGASTHRWRRTA